jgi:hypothetical protein
MARCRYCKDMETPEVFKSHRESAGQPGAVHHAVLSGDGGLTASRFCFPIHCATHRKSEIIGDLESLQAPLILDINGEAGFCVQIALKTGCSFG